MTPTKLTPEEHALLYFEAASNICRLHGDIPPGEVDKLVQVEMHSMNLTEAMELLTRIKMELKTRYYGDCLMITDE
ncbi:MAG: hypothetical protein AAF652_13615 [Cyanobacteria bacterium P01_C01_bin.72]